jgi:hypothetical protein
VVVQERRQTGGFVFREDAARAVLQEAVDHDPFEAGQAADLARRGLAGAEQVGRRRQGGGGRPHRGEDASGGGTGRGAGFEFEEDHTVPLVGDYVDPAAARGRTERAEIDRLAPHPDPRRPRQGRKGDTEDAADPPAERRLPVSQQALHVPCRLEDLLRGGIHDEQHAVRLDGAWDVDRFPVAIREVGRLHENDSTRVAVSPVKRFPIWVGVADTGETPS